MPSSARESTSPSCSRTSGTDSNRNAILANVLGTSFRAGTDSGDDLPVPEDDELGRGERLQAHGAPGVQLLGGDPDLGAEAEPLAVDPPGGGVHQDGGGV